MVSSRVTDKKFEMGQWHHWNNVDKIAAINLKKRSQTIILFIVYIGEMNFDYISFLL